MNIITVGSYCAGALISDLLNGVRSPFETSVIKSRWNHILKASDDGSFLHLVLPEHTQEWIKKTEVLVKKDWTQGKYFATHQPPHLIPNLDIFDRVINVTTQTDKSRFYRFLRHYYVEINGQKILQDTHKDEVRFMINICKYDPTWVDSNAPNVTNIEFEDVVEGRFCDSIDGDQTHMASWKKRNAFILQEQDPDVVKLWNEQERFDFGDDDRIAGREVDFYFKDDLNIRWNPPVQND